ncbi:MAG: hypothetical protein NVSMB45_03200 [Ginsengibacter sp.]
MKLKKISSSLIIAATVLFFIGCGSSAHIEKDDSVQLSSYKTYNWLPKPDSVVKKQGNLNKIAEQNIQNSTDQELQKNGYRKVTSNPDLLVSYDVMIDNKTLHTSDPVYSAPYSRIYYNPYTRRYGTLYYPSQLMGYNENSTLVKEGTVSISMIDAKTDKTIWQGWSSETLNSNYISSRDAEKDVRLIFKKFNPSK